MTEFAGLLTEQVELWQRTDERLATGVSSETWQRIGRYRACIEAEGVGKQVEGMSLSALCRYRVMVRARSEFSIGQRVLWRERRLTVRQILSDPLTPDRVSLRCEELRS